MVLDTNVIVGGQMRGSKVCKPIWDAALAERFRLITSLRLAEELEEALLSKIPGFLPSDARKVKRMLLLLAEVTEPEETEQIERKIEGICETDPDDDHVIAVAIAGKADLIVSGDKDILRLRDEPKATEFRKLIGKFTSKVPKIFEPGEFLKLLRRGTK